jgi:acetaldehyde dehydrogenase (acetylating)
MEGDSRVWTLRAAILGSGNIGSDLLVKTQRSEFLECSLLIGRSDVSAGLERARAAGVATSRDGIAYIEQNPECCDIVFDATSAAAHHEHAPVLQRLGKMCIDLTPARVGPLCVPAVNIEDCLDEPNVNMVTCGGQAAAPVAYAIGRTHPDVEYIEVISSIASRSAGPATRQNIDEYIDTTERAIKLFAGARRAKAILNLNPAVPCIDMQTTIFAKCDSPDIPKLQRTLDEVVARVQAYVPGYEVIVGPIWDTGRIAIIVRVRGRGDFLPAYAGNLDIINCAAIALAERVARARANDPALRQAI